MVGSGVHSDSPGVGGWWKKPGLPNFNIKVGFDTSLHPSSDGNGGSVTCAPLEIQGMLPVWDIGTMLPLAIQEKTLGRDQRRAEGGLI